MRIPPLHILVVSQPWAWAIFHGGRDVVNRDWSTRFRGRVAIHAPHAMDSAAVDWLADWFGLLVPPDLPRGQTVGTVRIVDCVSDSDSPWFEGPHGLVLRDPRSHAVEARPVPVNRAWCAPAEVAHA